MNLKKSVFSYIIWAVFAVLCCLGVVFALDAAEIADIFGWPYSVMTGAACGYLILTAAVFFALRTLCAEIGEHVSDRERLERIASVVLPAAVLVGIVVYLILYMLYHVPLTLEDDSFYRQAVVSAGAGVPFAVHGASFLYPHLLHVMLLVFGNTPFAGVVLQIILFFICLLLLYIGMQAFAGVVPAAISMAALGFLPVSLQFVFSLTPEFFFLAFYLSGFCLAGMLFQKYRERSCASAGLYFLAFLSGIYIGFLVYLDLYSISLFLFPAVFYSLDSKKLKQALGINLTILFGGGAGFILSVLLAARIGGMGVSAYLRELLALYTQNIRFERELLEKTLLLPDVTLVGSLLTVSFAFFVIPAFFLWKKSQNSAFILNLLLVYILTVFHVLSMNAQMAVTFSWSVLAGLGFYGVVRLPEVQAEDGTEEEMSAEEKRSEKAEGTQKKKNKAKKELSEKNDTLKEEKKSGEKAVKEELIKTDAETNASENKVQKKPAPGQPLHNPLPVPKKKSRSQVDFGYQVKEADMKFDVEVSDNDDFDV